MLPNKRKYWKKTFSRFCNLLVFLVKKQPKLTKNKENWQNQNCVMKFSKIWYVDVSQQNKMLQKNLFGISTFFGRFSTKKQPKLTKKWRKLAKFKPLGQIFWNFVCICFPTKENATKYSFLIWAFFLSFF